MRWSILGRGASGGRARESNAVVRTTERSVCTPDLPVFPGSRAAAARALAGSELPDATAAVLEATARALADAAHEGHLGRARELLEDALQILDARRPPRLAALR